jgi:dihydrodipicolinate synthase/N-acetylneuraminate lyase
MSAKLSGNESTWRGVVVPTLSPFTPDLKVDAPAIGRIVERLVGAGIEGIFPLGTTGEAASIGFAQRREIVEATVKAVQGRSTVYAGVAANALSESIAAAKEYATLGGVSAVVAHPPSYYAIGDDEMHAWFARLADASPLPLVLYNIPQTTHLNIALPVVAKLARHGNIVAIKDSSPDTQRIADLLAQCGGLGGFPVILGNSSLFTHGMKLGGVGLVPSGAHVVPAEYQAMYVAAMDKNWPEVERLQAVTDAAVQPYLKGRSIGGGLAKLKQILSTQGICGPTMMPPLAEMPNT